MRDASDQPENELIIGWRESISLPEWHLHNIIAKADTGAKSSAIDVLSIQELPKNRVQFEIALSRKNRAKHKVVKATIIRRVRVRSSNGQVTDRLVVSTALKIGEVVKRSVPFSLVCRKHMLCRVLLGRTALEGAFLVDSLHTYLVSNILEKKGPP